MKVARQFIAWDSREKREPSRRERYDWVRSACYDQGRLIHRASGSDRALRDGFLIARIPGNKLPGYDHLVPSGQVQRSLQDYSLLLERIFIQLANALVDR
jgi:hypothetical protein